MKTVYETIKTDNYMGWKSCTMQEAQEAANNGTAAIGISEDKIVVLSANDEEQPVTQTASVMTLTENTSAFAVDGMRYYVYNGGTTNYSWEYYANKIVSYANSFLGMTEQQVEVTTSTSLSNGQWCVDFVRLCCKLAGVYDANYTDIIPTTSSSTTMRNWFRNNYPTRFHEGVEGIRPGDIIFVASSSSSTNPYHTCIALSGVDSSGKVDTINGNWGDDGDERVRVQRMPVSGCIIKWYAYPNYELANRRNC
ncbi:MAG: hypothetical protein E7541_05290 [Ruminococcaceae bacterium]|nr:hypothetical protein [Oscillospiraceae bacterium]